MKNETATEPTTPQLSESEQINARLKARNEARERFYGANHLAVGEADKLIKQLHQWEEFDAPRDMAVLLTENAALREQLAQITGERDGLKRRIQEMRDERR